MNRGTLRGFAPAIGDYNPMPTGGAGPTSARGRISVDQIRLWGNPDNVAGQLAGGARLINTNAQSKTNNLFFTGDLGTVVNVGNGLWLSQTGFPPWEVAYNVAGQWNFSPPLGGANVGGMFGYVTNAVFQNQPGIPTTIPSLSTVSDDTAYIANGAACTLGVTGPDFSSSPAYSTSNAGTLALASLTNFGAQGSAGTGVSITTRTGFSASNFNVGAGTLTNQFGMDINLLTAATNNVGVRVFSGNTTLAANPGTCIQVMPSTYTYNFSNVTIPPAFSFPGTHILNNSGFNFGMGQGINFNPTFKTATSIANASSFGPFTAIFAQPTFTADTATGIGLGTQTVYQGLITANVANAGTMTSGTIQIFSSAGTNIGSGVTGQTLVHYNVGAPTVNGSVTTEVGLDIASLTNANVTTPIGVRIAAQANQYQASMSTTGPTTGNLTSNTNVVMTMYHGATNYYWLVAFNDGGTVRYKYLQLNGTGVTWVTGTTLPT